MITEKDVIDAWLYWHKIGLMPPPADNIEDFKKDVKTMHQYFAGTDKNVFRVAIIAAGKGNHRWPTIMDIRQAIKVQEDV